MIILKIIAMINSLFMIIAMLYFKIKNKQKDYIYDYIIIIFILNVLSIII